MSKERLKIEEYSLSLQFRFDFSRFCPFGDDVNCKPKNHQQLKKCTKKHTHNRTSVNINSKNLHKIVASQFKIQISPSVAMENGMEISGFIVSTRYFCPFSRVAIMRDLIT